MPRYEYAIKVWVDEDSEKKAFAKVNAASEKLRELDPEDKVYIKLIDDNVNNVIEVDFIGRKIRRI